MPQITRGQSTLYYEDRGQGQAVVLLHGVGGNHASWFHQVARWSAAFRLISVDARGFGNSTDAEGLGRSAFTDDLAYLLDALSLPKVTLIGQSMGGGTAVDFALHYPERVSGVVVADSLVWLHPPESLREKMANRAKETATLSQAERVLGPSFLRREPALTELYLQIASFNQYTVRTLPGTQAKHEPQALAATDFPWLFLAGEEDVLFPAAFIEEAASLVPNASFVKLAQAGHSAYFEQPDAFCEHVEPWIRALG